MTRSSRLDSLFLNGCLGSCGSATHALACSTEAVLENEPETSGADTKNVAQCAHRCVATCGQSPIVGPGIGPPEGQLRQFGLLIQAELVKPHAQPPIGAEDYRAGKHALAGVAKDRDLYGFVQIDREAGGKHEPDAVLRKVGCFADHGFAVGQPDCGPKTGCHPWVESYLPCFAGDRDAGAGDRDVVE